MRVSEGVGEEEEWGGRGMERKGDGEEREPRDGMSGLLHVFHDVSYVHHSSIYSS